VEGGESVWGRWYLVIAYLLVRVEDGTDGACCDGGHIDFCLSCGSGKWGIVSTLTSMNRRGHNGGGHTNCTFGWWRRCGEDVLDGEDSVPRYDLLGWCSERVKLNTGESREIGIVGMLLVWEERNPVNGISTWNQLLARERVTQAMVNGINWGVL
jgi:hypothetical protein